MPYFDNFEYGSNLLASTTLESTYATARSGTASVTKKSHVVLLVTYTAGAAETANTLELKVEYSDDGGTTWWQRTTQSVSGGTITVADEEYQFTQVAAGGTADYIAITISDVCARDIRVWAKETGVAANKGTVVIDIAKGGK